MRRAGLIAGFAAGAAVVLAALVWILGLTLRLEHAEAEARRHAAREERVRLALWRMDSALAAFLAFENARPVDGPGEGDEPPAVELRFEVGGDGPVPAPLVEPARLLSLLDQPALAGAVPPGVPAPPPVLAEPRKAPLGEAIVRAETELQSTANIIEFEQRRKVADQQSNLIDQAPPVRRPAAPSPRPAARPRGPTGVVRALEPVWVDGRLLLVRRVVRDGAESLQGIVLDEGALREELLGEVRDLLPESALEPVAPGTSADPGRRLALLPWRLEPGPVPEAAAGGRSSVRLGLATAAGAIVLAAATAGVLLLAGLRLARRRTDFASAVIHELRTPLTTFRLYTDLLAEGMVRDDERPAHLATLRREADRLGHLVENVLAFARLERRRPQPATPAALGPLLRAAAERLTRRAAEEGFELEVAVTPEAETAEVAIEPLAIERILDNLCDNSCRYGRGAGAGTSTGAGLLEMSAAVRGRRAVVRWRDRGPGVDRAARRLLFRPYRRAGAGSDPGARSPGGAAGVGLGLALSRQLARRSGGDLRYVDPGEGAAFELTLPLASARR